MKSKFLAFLTLLLPLGCLTSGCKITEGGRQENHQNAGAGHILRGNPDPLVASIGADVEDNSLALEGEIGAPDRPLPYSRENSAAARNAQASQLAARQAWKDLIDQALGAVAAGLGLGAVWGWLRSVKLGKVAESIIDGVEKFTRGRPDVKKELDGHITASALDVGAADAVKALVVKHTE